MNYFHKIFKKSVHAIKLDVLPMKEVTTTCELCRFNFS